MAATTLRKEEGYGLALAIAAHVGLAAFLLWRPPGKALILPPERMTVTISEDVGLTSTSPEPNSDAAPDFAPQAGEAQPAPEPAAESEPTPPKPQPKAEPEPEPRPKPVAKPEPKPIPKPVPRPVARPTPKPVPKPPAPRPVARPAPRPSPAARPAPPKPAAKPAQSAASRPSAQTAQRPTTAPAGGSRVGADFLKGVTGAQGNNTQASAPAAAAAGPTAASLSGAIARALKPRWAAPQGADADKLVTILAWNFNPDGSLAGTPRVVEQQGVTPANEAQKARHAEQAIRAVQLAAAAHAFDLPPQYYNSWKRVASFRFDRRLSQ